MPTEMAQNKFSDTDQIFFYIDLNYSTNWFNRMTKPSELINTVIYPFL